MSETTLLFDPDPADLLHAGHVESLYGHFLNGSNYNLSKSLPHAQGWEKLDPSSYISKYDKSFITDYHDLVLITQNTSFDRVVEFRKAGELALDLGSLKEPAYEQWMFRDRDDRIVKNKVGSVVTPETVMPGGKLMVFGQEIGAVKIGCIWAVVYQVKEKPLVNIGDAIFSFLKDPDPHTRGMCLATREDFEPKRKSRVLLHSSNSWAITPLPKPLQPHQYRWYHSYSLRTWFCCLALSLFGLLLTIIYLTRTLWNLGFEAIHSFSLLIGHANPDFSVMVAANVVIINLPQALLSFIYLFYNSLFTKMLQGAEWATYEHGEAKGFCVSERRRGASSGVDRIRNYRGNMGGRLLWYQR
ncbi:hypothetical protein EX30DRAFT_363205 [Ascodesmis nigricans]|uniref:Uncharacterized protein n=1 Tax=Ascodesmis nigricans TaxID=341454 RepID=A0A4S2MZ66_9PEZI|nr:hypothetical protein EX30DRAFT_363205 [Ascodesmis nigricans]